MADDIQVEEFNRGDSAQDDRLRPGDGGTAGGPNTNADLREKGDADDLAEAIIQGDAETATREVGLRSDSPVDLTRNEVGENRNQPVDESEGAAITELEQSTVGADTPQQIDGLEFSSNDAQTNGPRINREQNTDNNNVEVAAEAAPAQVVSANNGTVSAGVPEVPAAEIAPENLAQTDETPIPDLQDLAASGDSVPAQAALNNPAAAVNGGVGTGNGGVGTGNGGVGTGNGQGSTNGQGNGVGAGFDAAQPPASANGNSGNAGSNGNGGVGNGNGQGSTNGQGNGVGGGTDTVQTDAGGNSGNSGNNGNGNGGNAGNNGNGGVGNGNGQGSTNGQGNGVGGGTDTAQTDAGANGNSGNSGNNSNGNSGNAGNGGGNPDANDTNADSTTNASTSGGATPESGDPNTTDFAGQQIDGGNGKDILNGGAGDDTLTGGNGNDTFSFDQNFGDDVITDFKPGNDQLDLSELGIPDMETLLDHATMNGDDTVITTDDGTITLSNTNLNDLSAGDFMFGDAPATDASTTGGDTGGVVTQPDTTGTTGDAPAGDTGADTGATGGDTGGVATQPDTTATTGDTPAGDTGTTGGETGADTGTTGGDAPVIDTSADTGTTGGDTGGVATQPDTTGTGGDAPVVDTSADTSTDPVVDPVVEGMEIDGGNGKDTLEGGAGNDILDGGNGKDVLNGGAGDDILTGGNGNDTFAFEPGFGNDTITDFKPGNDQIDLSSVGIPDLPTLLNNAVMDGNDTVITTDEGTITLSDVNMNDLSADDFVFGDAPATDTSATGDTGGDTGSPDSTQTGDDTGGVATQPDPTGTTGDAPAGDNGTDTGTMGGDTGGVATQPDTTGTNGDTPAGETGTDTDTTGGDTGGVGTQPDTTGTGGDTPAGETVTDTGTTGGDTGGVATQPDITGTGGDAPAGDNGTDTGTMGGGTGGVATQPDTTGTNGDTPAGDTGTDTGTTGGDTGGVATQPDTTGTNGDAPAGDTGTDTGTTGGDTGGVATQPDTTGTDGDTPVVDTGADTGTDPVVEPVVDGVEIDGGNGKDTLEGDAGNDTLDGGNGKDVLNGGAGDDTLTGGNGNDTFAFEPGFGNDTITDFKPGNDQIDLSSVGIPDLPTLLNNAVMDGNDTVITTDEGTITLSDVNMNDLSADDFVFGDAPATDTTTTDDPGTDTGSTDTTQIGGDTGGVATQPDTTGTGGDAPASDTGTTGGDTGGVATQPDTTDTAGETPADDTGTTASDTGADTGTTGGDTGGVATQPDTTGTGGNATSGGTGADTGTTGGDTGGVATQPDTTGTGGDNTTGGSGDVPTVSDTPATDTPVAQPPAPTIEGDSGSNDIDGSSGVDVVNAGSGDDKVDTGAGDDVVNAGTGDDRVKGGDGNDTLDGGSGNDRLEGGDGADILTGGEGTDTLYGGDGGDTLGGGEGSDYLNSGKGDDVISGGSGNDKALGGDGSDTVDGGDGNDRVYGNNGDDTVSGGAGDDRAYGGQGDDIVSGGDGNDQVHGNSGNDVLDGGAGNDTLHGGSGEDQMAGGDGTDRLSGGTGSDVMDGGAGEDRLYGGSGDDVIDGGAGDDYLKGDSGADTFKFSGEFGEDYVSDFDVRESDAIDLSETEIGDFRSLMDNSRQVGNDTVIELDGGTITLNDVDRNDLSSDNFSFAEGAGMELSEPGSVHEVPDLPAFDSINARADGANGVAPDAVTVSSAQTVTMTFESESAGYQSSVGHYTVDADGVIQNVEMAWENASLEGSGGDLVGGESQVSFDVDAGARVGVFVVPNGHQQNDFEDMQDGHFEFRDDAGEPATINTPSPTLVFVHNDGNETVIDSQSGEIFHSAGPDMHGDNLEHSVSGVNDAGDLMIGFEDLVGGGDRDYEDVVLKVEFEPKMDEAAPAEEAAFSDGSGGAGALDMVSTDFDFVDDMSDGEAAGDEAVFNLDFTDLIPEGADEGQFEVRVSGLPSQVSSSKGEVDSDRNWTLTMMQVVGLTIAVPAAASAADLMEDVNFQVVDTESGQVVAEGLLDGEAMDAGETTISVLPQIVEEERGNRGKAKGHDKQEEKAAAEEAQAAEEATQPVVEDPASAEAVRHAPAGAPVAPVVEEVLPEQAAEQAVEAVAAAEETGGNGNGRGRGSVEANVAPTDLVLDTSIVLENAANGAVVGTVSATDANSGDSFTYSLMDDANGRFTIDPNTGRITVADASQLDYETDTSHDLTVKVTDSGGATYDEVMTINIGDAGDPPTGASVLTFAVGENSWWNGNALNTSVNVTDPDAGDTFTFAMVDDASGRFSIDADGTIRIADKSLLDYETSTNHDITFRITDSTGNTYDHTHRIHLYDENDTPTDLTLTANTVAENAANGTAVGTVSATDQDAGETFTYSLVNDQGGRFAIDSSTGVVTVADSSLLDFETATSHNLTIRVTDSGGATYNEVMAVNLTNANETPTDLKLTNVEIAEGAANGTVVGTAAVTDQDAGDTASYSLTNNAGGRFTINSSTGEITVADGSLLDYESNTSHDITVRITDGGGNTYDETYTIGVNDEREQSNTYEAEIVSHDPVGYWQMDEVFGSAGTHTMAATVGGVDAEMHNTDTGTENNAFGNISGAMTDFYGDDFMVIPDDAAWQLTDGTVQMIFKPESISGQHVLASRDSNGTNEGNFKIYLDGDDVVVRMQGTNGGTLTAADVITQNSWYQINVTFGSGGLEIWLNGTRVANDPSITGGIDGNTEPWVIGASSSATTTGDYLTDNAQWEADLGGHFNGDIGEFAIFGSQLDSTAINDMYDAGVNGHDSVASGSTTDNDMIHGTSGNDSLGGHNGDDFIYGGDGDDTIDGGAGNDVISGGAGTDTVDYSGFGAGATVNLTTGTATDGGGSTDTLSGVENVLGTNYADDITGNDADNVLTGNAGNDTLRGEDGDDTLYGGAGNDTLTGGAGDDLFQGGAGTDNMDGGAGIDTVTYDGAANGVTVNLATGTATDGSGDTDTLTNIENLIGSANNDTFTGNGSVNELTGGDGSDRFIMGEGGTMDTIHGGTGGGWTDTLQLMNTDASAVGGGWTVQLTSGSVASDDGSTMTLTDDAAGTVTLEDGSQIAFDGLERIEY